MLFNLWLAGKPIIQQYRVIVIQMLIVLFMLMLISVSIHMDFGLNFQIQRVSGALGQVHSVVTKLSCQFFFFFLESLCPNHPMGSCSNLLQFGGNLLSTLGGNLLSTLACFARQLTERAILLVIGVQIFTLVIFFFFFCNSVFESLDHLFFDCPFSWPICGICPCGVNALIGSLVEHKA